MKQTYFFYIILAVLLSLFVHSYVFGENENPHHAHSNKTEAINVPAIAVADGDTIDIKSVGADLSYDVTEIHAKAGSQLTVRYINESDMPHNVVFVNSEADIMPVGVAAIQALDTEYIPMNMEDNMFGWTELARPGETVYVTVTVPDPGTYPYICTYPGHFTMMQGRLISSN